MTCPVHTALPAWDLLPDFGLYMDQLLLYTQRCLPDDLTASMINSYVKAGIIDRPLGKKYSRESLAQLLIVAVLKPVMPLDSLRQLLHPQNSEDTASLYTRFLTTYASISQRMELSAEPTALDLALEAACYQRLSLQHLA